ncbi:MAG: hypothetical protein K2G11_08485 [Muribaculaceae bacterium]|nr:hypothetical protein [Muribaculaceae bacterium]
MLRPAPAHYVDGILRLHAQLDEACSTAYDWSKKYFLNRGLKQSIHEERIYRLFIDFTESQPENAVKCYFVFDNTIHRFLSMNLDYAVLFPVRDHSGWDNAANRNGITIAKLRELQRNREKVIISLSRKKDSRISQPLYVASLHSENCSFPLIENNLIDDIGNPYYFGDITILKAIELPKSLKSVTFSLVGKQYYAPLSTDKECYCVLYAQKDNEYDLNAIKVLRWFPVSRTKSEAYRRKGLEAKEQLRVLRDRESQTRHRISATRVLEQRKKKIIDLEAKVKELDGINGHCFFELGYISRNENEALHKYMIDNDSRLLFGIVKSDKISLMGGVEIFWSNDFDFPLSLSKINIK